MGELTAMNDTTMTKADLVEEVIRATELPQKKLKKRIKHEV